MILSYCVFLYQGFIGPPGVAGPPGLEGERVSLNDQLYNSHFTLMQMKCKNQGDAICMNESKVVCCRILQKIFLNHTSVCTIMEVCFTLVKGVCQKPKSIYGKARKEKKTQPTEPRKGHG